MKTIQFTLTDAQAKQVNDILSTRKDRSEKEIVELIVERGIYALSYRTKYNKVRYARQKDEMAEFREYKERLKSALSSTEKVVATPAPKQ
jgi:hypothetical protein